MIEVQVLPHNLLDFIIPKEEHLPILGEEAFREVVVQKLKVAMQQARQGAFQIL